MSALLPTRMVAKPWGRDVLPGPFEAPPGERIGEIWFEPPPALDTLLVKHIFTSEALSVQVHPSDAQAPAGHRGKEECWLVTSAEPGARLGIGFTKSLDAMAMRAAALDGSIEHLLEWHAVQPGDFFYIPANTVHAIGAGVGLVEVQQNCDITYRLYDYGRPRELHLEQGMAVARGAPYDRALHRQLPEHGEVVLVEGPHFRLARLDGAPSLEVAARYAGPLLVIPLEGQAIVAGEAVAPGQCALATTLGDVDFAGKCLIAQPC
jgi:mannose-6-phosphate isomerase